jgi:hypothetical protein
MAKHRAPSTAARIVRDLRHPSTEGEHAIGRLTVGTLAAIFVALVALVGIGTANAGQTAPAAPTPAVHSDGPHRLPLDLPVAPLPERTGAGTDLPAVDAPADPLAALVADGAGSADEVAAAAASLCGDDTAPARLLAAGWTDEQVTDLIDATDCD